MGLRALLAKSASAVMPHHHRRRASLSALPDTPPVVSPAPAPRIGRRNSLVDCRPSRLALPGAAPRNEPDADTDSDDDDDDEYGGYEEYNVGAAHKLADRLAHDRRQQPLKLPMASPAARGKTLGTTMATRAARLSATAAARITRLVGENPPMGSCARVVRRQYQSIAKEREKEYKPDDPERLDAVALYEVEFPKQPVAQNPGSSRGDHGSTSSSPPAPAAGGAENYPLGIDLETDFYGRHAVVKEVKRGSVAYALAKGRSSHVLKPGHVVVAVNGQDLTRLSFAEVLHALKAAPAPRVIRFLDPHVLPLKEYRHERTLVNRDQYGFAKDDKYILNYRRQLRKRKLAGYEHERRWADFVQHHGGIESIDRLLHDATLDPRAQTKRVAVMSELRELVLQGIPAVLRPRVWGVLTGAAPYRRAYRADYYAQLVARIDSSASISDIEKDIHRTYPEHVFFQSDQGRRELKHVLGAYSLHNPCIGYCQSMNFIAGMMVLLTNEEDAFWLFCALMEKRYLPAENYTQAMVGTQTDQLVFKELVAQELPVLAERLEFCGIQIQLVTLHWFLCAFVCTLPTESALRVWDWFCLDGQEVLFITAVGILKHAEPRIMAATLHSDLHTIVRELGTDLHDDDAFMDFLYALAPPSDIERREAGKLFEQVWECDNESSGGGSSSSSGCGDDDHDEADAELHEPPLEDAEDDEAKPHPAKEDPPVAWEPLGAASPYKAPRRKRTVPAMPVKFQNVLHTIMGSRRKAPHGSSTVGAQPAYQKQFTLQDIETLRSMYRPQFEKKTASSTAP